MWLWIGIAAAGGLLLFAVVIGLALAFVSTGAPIAANSTQSNSLPTATGNGANAPGSGLPRAGKSRKPIQFPSWAMPFRLATSVSFIASTFPARDFHRRE